MTAITANANVDRAIDQELREFPVGAAVHIWRGALVGTDPAGNLKAFEPCDLFVGIAYEEADNTASGASAGDVMCKVFVGSTFEFTLSGAALTDAGQPVYAIDSSTTVLKTGHPDALIGWIDHKDADTAGRVIVPLKRPGQKAGNVGSIDIDIDFAKLLLVDQDETVATLNLVGTGLRTALIGSGLTAGTTGLTVDDATGELEMLHSSDSQAQNVTLKSQQVFNITKGVTFEMEGRNKTAGGSATEEFSFGLAGGITITTTQEADMLDTTASYLYALFHMYTDALSVFAASDDNTTVIAPADTLIDNSLTVNKRHKVIVRPGGAVEFWINGARVLEDTVFSVGAAGLLAAIINTEKDAVVGVPEQRIRRLRVAGAIA